MIGLAPHAGNDVVGIRSLFPREGTDFTPWLTNNLKRLARPLGMKLRPIDYETWVPFGRTGKRVDILAEELNLDSPVVIENQYGQSDDNHLGRLLIYAGTTQARVAIWVAESFVREHLDALKWINDNSSESLQLYGVQIGTKTSESGRQEPSFEVVLHPSHWSRSDKRLLNVDPEDWRDRYEAFWQELVNELRSTKRLAKARSPSRDKFYTTGAGFSGIQLVARFKPLTKSVSVELAVRNPEDTDYMYGSLFWSLKRFDEEIALNLRREPQWVWSRYRSFSRISVSRGGSILGSPDELAEIQSWMVSNLLNFKKVFDPYLREPTY